MEKLQAAIEKARQQRETVAGQSQAAINRATPSDPAPAPNAKPTQMPSAASHDAVANWASLERIDLPPRLARRNRLFLDTSSVEASHFDKLRTKVLQQCRDNGWRRLIIASATKSCGKTTIASNLAASFTRQRDRRVILLDVDMRRPEMAQFFRQKGRCSFSDVLEERKAFSECAFRLGENVAVAVNGAPHQNPSELLLRDRTPEILDAIEADFQPDLMVFDTPPLLATDDTMVLLKNVDCALIVAAAETTTTDHIDVVEKEIASQTNVMGVILNQCIYMDGVESYYG